MCPAEISLYVPRTRRLYYESCHGIPQAKTSRAKLLISFRGQFIILGDSPMNARQEATTQQMCRCENARDSDKKERFLVIFLKDTHTDRQRLRR